MHLLTEAENIDHLFFFPLWNKYDLSQLFQLSEQSKIILTGKETVNCNTKLTNTAKDIMET